MRSDLVDDLDQLHGGERLSGSILNGCQDLLLSLLSVADVEFDLHACVLDHRSVTCSHNRGKNAMENNFTPNMTKYVTTYVSGFNYLNESGSIGKTEKL